MGDKAILTRVEILAICDSGDFSPLVGQLENSEFDCKMQPYILADDKGKRELAKDVSAFANAGGGVIVLGVKTEASPDHFGDEVTEINLLPQNLVNPIQYNDVLTAWLYPPIAGLSIMWKALAKGSAKGVVVIDIPPQLAATKPILIAKTLDGAKVVESIFGYAVRKGETSPPYGVKELQQQLASGLAYDSNLDARLGAIEAALEALVGSTHQYAQTEALATQLAGAVTSGLAYGDLKDRRTLILVAQPTTKAKLATIFASGQKSLKNIVEHPPILRSSGWSVETTESAKIVQGKFIRATNGPRKVLDLYADGTMVFIVTADKDFLTWGKRSDLNINPLALIEVIYSFMALYAKVLDDFTVTPGDVQLHVGLRHMRQNGNFSLLGPGGINSIAQQMGTDTHEAPADCFDESYTEVTPAFDAEIAAYEIARLIYLWFGLPETAVPYVYDKGDRKAVNSAMIATL